MDRLEYSLKCLDGTYCFSCTWNDEDLEYEVKTDIEVLESKIGNVKAKPFTEELRKANLERWDRSYEASNPIEDGTKWKVKAVLDDIEYVSYGDESFYPYDYEHLIAAIILCDEKAEYCMI